MCIRQASRQTAIGNFAVRRIERSSFTSPSPTSHPSFHPFQQKSRRARTVTTTRSHSGSNRPVLLSPAACQLAFSSVRNQTMLAERSFLRLLRHGSSTFAKDTPKCMSKSAAIPHSTRPFSVSRTLPEASGSASPNNDGNVEAFMKWAKQMSESSSPAAVTGTTSAQPPLADGLKFPLPDKQLAPSDHLRQRYDPVLDLFTKLLMQDGKLTRAQKTMDEILTILRTSPPPKPKPERPLISGPSPSQLPLDPIVYLNAIVDSVGPLLRIRQIRGAAGGGMALPIPHPLNQRQRRRIAIRWIIDASDKRRKISLATRVSEELLAVAEGRSSVWMKREQIHKASVSARANVNIGGMKKF